MKIFLNVFLSLVEVKKTMINRLALKCQSLINLHLSTTKKEVIFYPYNLVKYHVKVDKGGTALSIVAIFILQNYGCGIKGLLPHIYIPRPAQFFYKKP